jgi:cyanophycinase
MAQSAIMVAGGSSGRALSRGEIKIAPGLGLIEPLIIDTHFVNRGRYGRLLQALCRHGGLLGLGLAEDTGVTIEGGTMLTVIGTGQALVFDADGLTDSDYLKAEAGAPFSAAGFRLHVLAQGMRFSIPDREVLPPISAK